MTGKTPQFNSPGEGGKPIHKKTVIRELPSMKQKGLETRAKNRKKRKKKSR